MTLSSVDAEAVNANIKTLAKGVLVADACAAAMVHMTAMGKSLPPPSNELSRGDSACTKAGAAAKSGKTIPPVNFPAPAKTIAMNLATPTCSAAHGLAYGMDGSTCAA